MIKSLTIELPLPPAAVRPNSRANWRVKARYISSCRYQAMIACKVALQGHRSPMWAKAVMCVEARFPTWQAMDPGNLMASLKSHEDGIQDAGIIVNDRALWPERPVIVTRSSNPGITLTITPEY